MEGTLKFRHHRGSLLESLKTTVGFTSLNDLEKIVSEPYQRNVIIEKFDYVGLDERCGWETFHVICRFEGTENAFVAGMSDGIPTDFKQ